MNATSGVRAPTSTQPAAGSSRLRAEIRLQLSRRRHAAGARRAPRAEASPGASPARARRRGTRAARARPRRARQAWWRSPSRHPSARARRRRSARRRRRRSADGRRRGPEGRCAPSRTRCRQPTPRRAQSPVPPSVNTDRLWSTSACTSSTRACAASASRSAAIVSAERPSEKFGTASRGRAMRAVLSIPGAVRTRRAASRR